jgi:class 3 adenylate cyclase
VTGYRFKTLRGRLMAQLITPVVIILLAAGIGGFAYARNRLLDQWNQNIAIRLGWAAQEIEMRLSEPLKLMQVFAKIGAAAADADLLEAIVLELEKLPGIIRTDLSWYSRSAEHLSRAGDRESGGKGPPLRFQRGAFAQIAPPEQDKSVDQPAVTIKMALLDASDTPVGDLRIVIRFDNLVSEITTSEWWQNAMACFVDRQSGQIFLSSGQMQGRQQLGENGDPLETELLGLIRQDKMGTILGPGLPPDRVAGFHRLEMFPWALVVFADGETILAPVISFRNGFIIGSAGLLLITYAVIWFNVDRVTSTVRHLSSRVETVAEGNFGEKITVTSRDEIGQLATSFNAMVDGLKERDMIRNTFGQYVDPDFAAHLLEQPETGRLGGRRQEVAIFMADIRGFTPMVEDVPPEATIDLLNRYFSAIIPLIQAHSGIIVDFIGDAILVFFEPMGESARKTVERALQCAVDMQRTMAELSRALRLLKLPELKIGIGIHYGAVVVGNIGSEARKKYGIVGACVNAVQRIQGQSEAGETLVSEAAYRPIASQVVIIRTISASLKGVSEPLTLYAIQPNPNPEKT